MSELKNGSVLPDNRSLFERGLEIAFTQLLYEINNPYPQLLNPRQTNQSTLPYLAQDKGVTEWDANAPESEQRQTVANAWHVRRLAGTKKGLTLAMDSLEYDAEVTPWYQMLPRGLPYHFEIVAWKRKNAPINKDVVHRMHTNIENSKSERDTYELILALGIETGLSVSAVHDRGITIFDELYQGAISNSPILSVDFYAVGAQCIYLFTDLSPGAIL